MSNSSARADAERCEFSARLKQGLHGAGFSEIKYTTLAREFNARSGLAPLTVHAARKWITGEAIPTQERLVILANWLMVSPEWLRFGHDVGPGDAASPRSLGKEIRVLLADIGRLDEADRVVVRVLVRLLVRKSQAAKL